MMPTTIFFISMLILGRSGEIYTEIVSVYV